MKNKKIIAIGDTHGRNKWKDIVTKEHDTDRVIFLGDYFDSFNIPFEEQMNNFLSILEYKRSMPDKVVLLLGNHEYHYLTSYSFDRYSGHQLQYAGKIEEILEQAIKEKLIKVAHMEDGYLCTHAGLTKTWMVNNNIIGGTADLINLTFKKNPGAFKFTPYKTGLDNVGDSVTQSPIWVRPMALLSDLPEGLKQVVGHTHQPEGINEDVSGHVFFIDTLDYRVEYLIINNGTPKIGVIK